YSVPQTSGSSPHPSPETPVSSKLTSPMAMSSHSPGKSSQRDLSGCWSEGWPESDSLQSVPSSAQPDTAKSAADFHWIVTPAGAPVVAPPQTCSVIDASVALSHVTTGTS